MRKQTNFNINAYFTIRTTHIEFQTSTTVIPQGNLSSIREIKEHIWQRKSKENCSRSEVYYNKLSLNDSCNIMKWSTITSRKCHYFFIIPHHPDALVSFLQGFLQFSWQKLGSWILLAVELVTSQVLCLWPNAQWARSAPYVGFSSCFQTAATTCVRCIPYGDCCAQGSYLMTDVHNSVC